MSVLGEVVVRLTAEISGLKRSLTESQRLFNNFADKVKKSSTDLWDFGEKAAEFGSIVATALGAAGAAGVKYNADMETATTAFETLLGSAEAAKKMIADLQQFANVTPFEFPGVQKSAKLMLAMGFSAQEIIPNLNAVGNAVAAIGGGDDVLNGVTLALGQMMTKGKVSAEEMNQLAERGIAGWDIMAQKLGMSKAELMNLSAQGKIFADQALPALINGMNERYAGAMEKQSQTFKGMLSTVKDWMNQTLGTMTQPIFERITQGLREFMQAIQDLKRNGSLDAWVRQVQSGFTALWDTMVWVGKALVTIAKTLIEHWGTVSTVLLGVVSAIAAFKVLTVVINLLGLLRGALLVTAEAGGILNAVMVANPLYLLAAAIGVVIAACYALYRAWTANWGGIRDKTYAVMNLISAYASSMLTNIAIGFNRFKAGVFTLLSGIMNAVLPVVHLIGRLAPGFEAGFANIQQSVAQSVDDIQLNLEGLQATAVGASDAISKASDGVAQAFSSWETPADTATAGVTETTQSTFDFATAMAQAKQAVDAAGDSVKGAADKTSSHGERMAKVAEEVKSAWQMSVDTMTFKLGVLDAEEEKALAQLGNHADKAQEVAVKTDFLNKKMLDQTALIENLRGEYQRLADEKGQDDEATRRAYLEMVKADAEMAKMKCEVASLTDELADQEKQFNGLSGKVVDLAKRYRDDLAKALDDHRQKSKETRDRLADDERQVTDNYKKELQSRADALANFVGLFDAVEHKKVNGSELLANLGGQVSTFRDWQTNLKALGGRGLSTGLMEELQKLGPKAADQVAALTTLTDAQLQQYVALWQEKSNLARSEAVNELSDLAVETQQKISELRQKATIQLQSYTQEWQQKTAEIRENALKDLRIMVDDAEKMGAQMVTRLAAVIAQASPELAVALQGFDPKAPQGDSSKAAQDQKKAVLQATAEQKAGVITANQETVATVLQTWTDAATQLFSEQTLIKDQTMTTWQTLQGQLSVLWAKMLLNAKTTWADMRKFLFEVTDSVSSRFNTLVASANRWGVSLVSTFINGIRSQFSRLSQVLFDMTSMVNAYMPHSPAKVGPLSSLGETGPGLVRVFADGIEQSLPYLARATAKMASIASPDVSSNGCPMTVTVATGLAAVSANGATFNISITGSNGEEIWQQLERQLARRGVKF
ncbi:tape measure protein [Heliophilum fasciatum]|uniref:Tape measure domain-containing protein n=1 Tax=Heliophilum fasciatum TaxID=35700 RepID=A0A4R2RNA2_9FIRM|nr:tape measure protein [Heliophilum fasciatum]MCW2279111.1 tape measure domain-containing protein [Heliophilum fasciatum]TCP61261.1 tape measure domain-containing protein [Heliophilum fasciatum]